MRIADPKSALRDFAATYGPDCIAAAGGRMKKDDFHREMELRFTELAGDWPEELDRLEAGVRRRRATNAIAWALSDLNREGVTRRATASRFVELAGPGDQPSSRPSTTAAPEVRAASPASTVAVSQNDDDLARVEHNVLAKARSAMGRARAAGVPYDEDFDVWSLAAVREGGHRCGLSGLRFDVGYRTTGAGATHFAPSPDRIEPDRGYVRGNVRWILWALNRAKGTMDVARFEALLDAVATRRGT